MSQPAPAETRLSRPAAALFVAWLAACGLAGLNGKARADPMRPLPGAPGPSSGATPGSAAAQGAAPGAAQVPPGTPVTGSSTAPAGAANPATPSKSAPAAEQVLVAIRQDSDGQRMALLRGRWLRVGERFSSPGGEVEVVLIGAHHVDVREAKGMVTLHLLPPLVPVPTAASPAQPGAASVEPARPRQKTPSTPAAGATAPASPVKTSSSSFPGPGTP